MPQKNNFTECIGDYFLINSTPRLIGLFNLKFLSEGNSLYEVFRIHNGIPLFFNEHIERLLNSVKASNLKFNIPLSTITEDTKKLISINNIQDGNIKLVLNEKNASFNFLLYFDNFKYPTTNDYKNGINLGLYDAERIDPNIKYVNLKLRSNAKTVMSSKGFYELLLVKDHKYITEGSRSNAFFIRDNIVLTPPLQYVLPGITREKVIQDCHDLNYQIIEKKISLDNLRNFESGFITGTSPKVLTIKSINDINYNVENKMINAIAKRYDEIADADLAKMSKNW